MSSTHPIMEYIIERKARQRGRSPSDAVDFIYMSTDENFDVPYEEVQRIQLATLRARFETLMEKVAPLRQLAANQNITRIDRVEDAAPLLFGPKVLKSYPISLLENNQFDKLTTWLGRLTTHNLRDVDVSGCETIDQWLDTLEAQSPMMVMHSSGTTGKLSIMPRSRLEMAHFVEIWWKFLDGYKGEFGGDIFAAAAQEKIPMFLPTYKHGRHVQLPLNIAASEVCGDDSNFIAAYPGRLSADLLSLGGRLEAAAAKGESGRLNLNPALLAQRNRLQEFQQKQGEYMQTFFDRMLEYQGRRVLVAGTWTVHVQATLAAEQRGMSQLFAPNSFIGAGGGKKGANFPDDWYDRVCRMYGQREIRTNYGMTEMTGKMQQCSELNFHPWPFQIIYQLNIDTGALLPREGTQRGRFAFMDLSAETYWGGGVSGDEVTVSWDQKCACGRPGPFISPTIARLSEQQGGDDKISCSGAQAAHDKALAYLANL